ncbi:fungal-specific transcription factor domain-containing protein [Camillea tinctor]|nr:fungal-specific transcription factor domain-containing protein [Camillea tinctor]
MARACQFCRRRKIKCNAEKPECGTCRSSNRTCVYYDAPPKPRPSASIINTLQQEKSALERALTQLKAASVEQREILLNGLTIAGGKVLLSENFHSPGSGGDVELLASRGYMPSLGPRTKESVNENDETSDEDDDDDDDDDYDNPNFLSVDETCQARVYGATSSLPVSSPARPTLMGHNNVAQAYRDQLIASAAIGRQREHHLRTLSTIRGVPAEVALHLLDLHWNRQHHTFLLTYRPAFSRELVDGGPYCTDFLLNAVFACASKFSERISLRSDPSDPESAGQQFFSHCDTLLHRDSLLTQSSIPTVIGLLMLGSTFNARGSTTKGWLYTGYAIRMVYDLGLHLDSEIHRSNAEEVEIRRRVFWGAFICEKLQSLYLGRPVFIQLRDANVSLDFMDVFEELEPWAPYTDPTINASDPPLYAAVRPPLTYSVSVFQQFCTLSKIMTKIINKIYPVGPTARKMLSHRRNIHRLLCTWYHDLPPHLKYEPWTNTPERPAAVTPHLTILHMVYYCLVILLHRPFISHRGTEVATVSTSSWKKCSTAARNITNLALSYRATYPLRKSSYLLSYAVYVACTIHVHNAAPPGKNPVGADLSLLEASLKCLDELAIPNSGVADTTRIIRSLMRNKGIQETPASFSDPQLLGSNDIDTSWQLFEDSPATEELNTMRSFSDFDVPGQDLLFGFMDDNFSISSFMPQG